MACYWLVIEGLSFGQTTFSNTEGFHANVFTLPEVSCKFGQKLLGKKAAAMIETTNLETLVHDMLLEKLA